jgi:hypothetical protein
MLRQETGDIQKHRTRRNFASWLKSLYSPECGIHALCITRKTTVGQLAFLRQPRVNSPEDAKAAAKADLDRMLVWERGFATLLIETHCVEQNIMPDFSLKHSISVTVKLGRFNHHYANTFGVGLRLRRKNIGSFVAGSMGR